MGCYQQAGSHLGNIHERWPGTRERENCCGYLEWKYSFVQTAHCVGRLLCDPPQTCNQRGTIYQRGVMKVELSDRRCEFTSGHSGCKVDMSTTDWKTFSILFLWVCKMQKVFPESIHPLIIIFSIITLRNLVKLIRENVYNILYGKWYSNLTD